MYQCHKGKKLHSLTRHTVHKQITSEIKEIGHNKWYIESKSKAMRWESRGRATIDKCKSGLGSGAKSPG